MLIETRDVILAISIRATCRCTVNLSTRRVRVGRVETRYTQYGTTQARGGAPYCTGSRGVFSTVACVSHSDRLLMYAQTENVYISINASLASPIRHTYPWANQQSHDGPLWQRSSICDIRSTGPGPPLPPPGGPPAPIAANHRFPGTVTRSSARRFLSIFRPLATS